MRIKLLLLLTIMSSALFAQNEIELSNLYDGTFRQESVYNINWMKDGNYYTQLEDNQIQKMNIETGALEDLLVDGNELDPSLNIRSYSMSADESKILIATEVEYIYRRSYKAFYYVYDLNSSSLRKVRDDKVMYSTFSPSADKVAYVFENNLYIKNLGDESVEQVTTSGEENKIVHGGSDWVYEEEFYITNSFRWSPEGDKLAYLSMDESEVKEYTLQMWNNNEPYPTNYVYKYPKAGEQNSVVTATIYDLETKKKVSVDVGPETDQYIPRIQWTKDNTLLSLIRMNRRQNKLEILHADSKTGATKVVLEEISDTYVALNYCDDLTYLDDGKHFLYSSEQDGFKHLYLYTVDGKLVRQITKGNWEVTSIKGFDQMNKKLYYLSTENSPLDRSFYEIGLNGKGKKLLSESTGITDVNMSKDQQYYIRYYNNPSTPLQVDLYKTRKNKKIKNLKNNARLKATAEEYALVAKEFFSFKVEDDVELNGYFLKPADFDPNKKYPVIVYQYSGPGSQQVQNSWSGSQYYWHQMMAQKGYIIAVVDPRGTGARGEAFKKITYRQLGKYETLDLISAGKYLAKQPFVDSDRIGIWGWSYGGFMAGNVILDGADVFSTAVSVAMVSNFRFYDTIYTERYMDTPQSNPEGYDNHAPLSKVAKLKGNYLVIHGTGDDNVHVQNSIVYTNALLEAGKEFDMFYYPDRTHGIYEGGVRPHLFEMLTKFWINNL